MTGNSLWYLIVQSDAMSKAVLLCLLGMSLACWTIFFFKLMVQRIKIRHVKQALYSLSVGHTLNDLKMYASAHARTIVAYMIHRNSDFAAAHNAHNGSEQDIDTLNDQLVDEIVVQEQSFITVLSTCAMVAPLLGLFGTVWGLVHAFLSIAQHRNADITTVAPGIAEALITTLAGLIVAIPAQIMYNIVVARIRSFDGMVMRCSDIIRFVFKRAQH